MQLALDIGNTNFKYFFFEGDKLVNQAVASLTDLKETLDNLRQINSISEVVVANVSHINDKAIKTLFSHLPLVYVSPDMVLPFSLGNKNNQMGADRIALVASSRKYYPDFDSLVIDLGTCITYDYTNKNGQYLGGAISPGFATRYASLHRHGAKLPDLSPCVPKIQSGCSTSAAMHSGVFFGIVAEVTSFIDYYESRSTRLKTIITGGDAAILQSKIKNSIFAEQNFIAYGLHHILQLNKV